MADSHSSGPPFYGADFEDLKNKVSDGKFISIPKWVTEMNFKYEELATASLIPGAVTFNKSKTLDVESIIKKNITSGFTEILAKYENDLMKSFYTPPALLTNAKQSSKVKHEHGDSEMALNIDIDAQLLEVMEKLGCPAELISAANYAGLVVEYQTHGVKVKAGPTTKNNSGELLDTDGTFFVAPIKLGVLEMILSGNIQHGAAKNLARIGLEKAVKQMLALTSVKIEAPTFLKTTNDIAVQENLQKDKDLAALFGKKAPYLEEYAAPPKPTPYTDKLQYSVDYEEEPIHIPKGKMKLANATELYQPVNGSDADSTYFTVALSAQLKIAVRIKSMGDGSKVSIRAEGVALNQAIVSKFLSEAGMTGNDNHWSVHLHCQTDDLVRKSIGAVLFGAGYPFKQLTSNLLPIWGKGA